MKGKQKTKNIFKTSKRGIAAILTLCILLGIAGTCVYAASAMTEETDTTAIEEITQELVPQFAKSCSPGIGGVGWEGDPTWNQWIRNMQIHGGDVALVGGVIPNRNDAFRLINVSGGNFIREEIHSEGGISHQHIGICIIHIRDMKTH